jgi:hypothetical protein
VYIPKEVPEEHLDGLIFGLAVDIALVHSTTCPAYMIPSTPTGRNIMWSEKECVKWLEALIDGMFIMLIYFACGS